MPTVEPPIARLIAVLEEARIRVADPDNDFSWSSWLDCHDASQELEGILVALRSGVPPRDLSMGLLFAPTGPMQEVSLSSGWGEAFLALADRFDAALAAVEAATDDP